MTSTPMLTFENHEEMNLAGLMLGGIIARNIRTPSGAKLASRLSGNLGVVAGKMKITIAFDKGDITIARGLKEKLVSRVNGPLAGLLSVSLGKGPVRAYVSGDISFKGNPFFLFKLLPLIRAASEKGA